MFIPRNGVDVNDISADELEKIESSWPAAEPLDLAPYTIDEDALTAAYASMKDVKLTSLDRSMLEIEASNMPIEGKALAYRTAYYQLRGWDTAISKRDLMEKLTLSSDGAMSAIKSFSRHTAAEVIKGSGRRPSRYRILTPALA